MKAKSRTPESTPIVVRQGSVSATIYPTANRIYRTNPVTRRRELKSEHSQFTLVYWHGSKRVRQKFTTLEDARSEANLAVIKLANGESEVLKLTGTDRADYVKACQKLRDWNPTADLNLIVAEHVAAVRRLPPSVSLKECVDFWLKRNPAGLPVKSVREVVAELIKSKSDAGKSDLYIKDLDGRLNRFATAFEVPIESITSAQIETFLRGLGRKGRTQNNYRRIIGTLFKFAIRRGYLPKDHCEIDGVERADDDSGEIEIFTPDELAKLFAAGRPEMVPYLAIAAFCGLRAAEVARLDWNEVHLDGPERFIEVKASKSKTASRRTVPIPDNCLEWLRPHVQTSGSVCPFQRPDKQCYFVLAPAAGIVWKRNGLRHGFCSYRTALVKDVGRVALEAGNSAQMIFKHYRQLVSESAAQQWFSITPPKTAENVLPMPAEFSTPKPAPTLSTAAAANA